MPAQRKIGAVIGLEGAREYTRSVKEIVSVTKAMEAGLKSVGKQMESESRTISDANNLRKKLSATIEVYNQKLSKQLEMQQKLPALYQNAQIKAKGYEERLKDIERTQGKSSEAYKELAKAQAENDKVLNNAVTLYNEYEKEIQETNATIQQHRNELERIPSAIKMVTDAYKNASNELTEWGSAIKSVGSFMSKYVTAPIVGGAAASVKFAKDFESAFVGVQKTVEATPEQFEALKNEIWEIAQTSASSAEEVAAVMEVAGQLGVGVNEISDFTRAMIAMGDATNLAASDAASEIATILNITGKGAPISARQTQKLGNAIVRLGNNFNTTEADITHMSARLAAGATLANLTTADIVGLAAAMSSVGINAEAGGSSMSTTLSKIQKEVANFNAGAESNLGRIAEISGTTAEEFAQAWMDQPMEAIKMFIRGLGNLDGASGETVLALDELGMANIRESNMLKSLALAADVLDDSIRQSNDAFSDGNDLADEAAKRYETFDSKLSQLKETAKELGVAIGEDLIDKITPMLKDMTEFIDRLTDGWNNMSPAAKNFVEGFGGIIAAVGPVMVIGGNLLIWLGKIKGALEVLGGGGAGGLLGEFTKGLGGMGKAAETAAGSGGFGSLLGKFGLVSGAIALINWGFKTAATTSEEEAAKIKETWDTNIDGIVEKMTGMPTYFDITKDDISTIVDDMADHVQEQYAKINDNATRYSQDTRRYVVQSFDDMGFETHASLSRTKENLTATTDDIKTDTIADFEEMEQFMIQSLENARAGISEKTPEVEQEIHKMVVTGVDDIRWMNDSMWSYGSDMMSNLASGISAGTSWVIEKVKAVANSIWSYLHFSEPETGPLANFNTWMPDMMKQMAKGINDNSWMVEDAINNVAGRMSIDPTTNSYNYGGVVINLNVPEGANGQMIVDDIEEELANRTMRRRAVFG